MSTDREMIKHYTDEILNALQVVENSEAVACILSWALMIHVANSEDHVLVGTIEYIEQSLRDLLAQRKLDKIVSEETNAPTSAGLH